MNRHHHFAWMKPVTVAGILSLTILLGIFCALPAEAAISPLASRSSFYFDTVITIALYDTDDETILDRCNEQMAYFESILSRTVEGSDVWNINHSGGKSVTVSDDTIDVITRALEYCELSGGALDITIAPVVDLWDFHEDSDKHIPADDTMEEALTHVDYHCVQVDGNTVTLTDPGAGIDLGAIAKGYISDRVRETILEGGCKSALINLGGNVLAVGGKPDGSAFNIGIRRPFGTDAYDLIAKVAVDDLSVITSGTYERYFILDDRLYHHILDPDNGYPIENGLTSVTILSEDATAGDALSTACFVLGADAGMELIETLDGVEALFIDENEKLTGSSGWPAS